MELKKFNELSDDQLDEIINVYYKHWSKFSPVMTMENILKKIKNNV